LLTSFSQYDAPLKLPYSNSNILAILVTAGAFFVYPTIILQVCLYLNNSHVYIQPLYNLWIPNLQPGDIRRSIGTILYRKGVSLRVIKDALHHSNVAAAERYLGITAQELDNAYDALCENKEINSYNEDFVQNEKWTQNGL